MVARKPSILVCFGLCMVTKRPQLAAGGWMGDPVLGLVELIFSLEHIIRWQSVRCRSAQVQPNVISHLHVYKLETHNPTSKLFVRLTKLAHRLICPSHSFMRVQKI